MASQGRHGSARSGWLGTQLLQKPRDSEDIDAIAPQRTDKVKVPGEILISGHEIPCPSDNRRLKDQIILWITAKMQTTTNIHRDRFLRN